MARVSVSEVTAVINTNLTDPQVSGFIDDASLWVDENLLNDNLSDALLKGIEKYLACWLVTLRDPRLRRARFGDADETRQMDDKISEYLKAAIALDPTGKVQQSFVDTENKVPVRWRVGTSYTDQASSDRRELLLD